MAQRQLDENMLAALGLAPQDMNQQDQDPNSTGPDDSVPADNAGPTDEGPATPDVPVDTPPAGDGENTPTGATTGPAPEPVAEGESAIYQAAQPNTAPTFSRKLPRMPGMLDTPQYFTEDSTGSQSQLIQAILQALQGQ